MVIQHANKKVTSWSQLVRTAVSVLATVALVSAVLVMIWIWNPPSRARPAEVDAVVVLAYGQDRLRLGRRLAEENVSDTVVISISNRTERRIAEGEVAVLSPGDVQSGLGEMGPWIEVCEEDFGRYRTICIEPEPDTTEGEAVAVRGLMELYDWNSLVIVTERSHMRRALQTFDACTSGDVYGEVTDRSGPWHRDLRRTVYEAAAIAKNIVSHPC